MVGKATAFSPARIRIIDSWDRSRVQAASELIPLALFAEPSKLLYYTFGTVLYLGKVYIHINRLSFDGDRC